MKITFDKLETTKPYVEVKADIYKSTFYDVDTTKTNGIELNPKIFKSLDDLRFKSVQLDVIDYIALVFGAKKK